MVRRSIFGWAFAVAALVSPAAAQDFADSGTSAGGGLFGIFDEVRTGGSFSVQDNDDSGLIIRGELLFKTFVPPFQNYFLNTLLRPRIHVGGNLATDFDDGINQVFGGFTWNFPVFNPFFIEASFGGTVHDGPLESPQDNGIDLGCNLLFRESIGVGADLGDRWRVLVAADHSSHADFCTNGGNSGLTHVGGFVGYRF